MREVLGRTGLVAIALLAVLGAGVGVVTAESTVTVGNATVNVDQQASVDVTIDSVPDGIQKYRMTVSLADGSVGDIEGARGGAISGQAFDVVSHSSDSITFRVPDFSNEIQPGDGPVTLATIDLVGTSNGSTDVTVQIEKMTDENGNSLSPAVAAGSLTVEGSKSPSDLGRFDANGNGRLGFQEVLDAIAAFNEGRDVGGAPVTFDIVLDVIAAFNEGTSV